MPIPELIKFREKYPEYGDLDDTTLAQKLASKYPEYGDLLGKVKVSQPSANEPSYLPPTTGGKLLAGIGGGMVHLAEGAKQRGMEIGGGLGLVGPQKVKDYQEYIDQMRKVDQPLMETTPGKIGEVIGQSLPLALVPGGVGGGALMRAGTSALAGAGAGALQPTTSQESPLANAGIGAVMGGGTSGALSSGGKIYNVAAGKVNNAVQDVLDKYGLRGTLGDITQNPRLKKAETWLEEIPVLGLSGFRKKQHAEAEQVAKGYVAKYVYDPAASDIRQMNKDYSNALFQNLEKTVSGIDQKIVPSETKTIAKGLLDRYPEIFKTLQDSKTESVLRDISRGTKNKTQTTISYDYPTGKSIKTETPIQTTLDFNEAWTLRQGLGDLIGKARKKIAAGDIDETQLGELKSLFGAVSKDIDNWTNQISRPDIKAAITTANNSYKDLVVKYGLIEEAYSKAASGTSAKEIFSPKTFSTELKKIVRREEKGRYGSLFSDQEIDQMTGMANVMQYVKRAGEYMENPPTGNRWGLPVFGGGLLGYGIKEPATAVLAGTGLVSAAGIARFMTSTKMGKSLALTASRVEPDSATMKLIMRTIYNQVPKVGAIEATSQ